jgi:hypothetical protein
MNQKRTFWDIITAYSIEIPTIQRDYTYGRERAKKISQKLISSILDSIVNQDPNENLHLDFIYGKLEGVDNYQHLERNRQSIDTLLNSLKNYAHQLYIEVDYKALTRNRESADMITFIPLDGQQRLTTLFLIHWYLCTNLRNDEALKRLECFTYATRKSSSDFLKMLCQIKDIETQTDYSIAEQITNNELFFTFWKKDPTVYSILVVLDEIEKQFQEKNINFTTAWDGLVNGKKVTFDFFDLDDFDLTDELYVKMNARGKKLSHFENFKAWLIKSHSSVISVKQWKNKIDISWNDLFWNSKVKGDTEIDSAYLQYFKLLYLGDIIQEENPSEEEIEILRGNIEDSPLDIFKTYPSFRRNINSYLQLLDYLEKNCPIEQVNPIFKNLTVKDFLFRENKFTWWDATLHYAITRYIISTKGDLTFFNQWLRVISNLIYNTPIESPKLYKEACQSILKLLNVQRSESIYQFLNEFKQEKIDFFLPAQCNEEILKANRIIEDPENDWENLFIKLEQHDYFFGQIGFIFNLFNGDINYKSFINVAHRAEALFSEEVMNGYNNMLFRAFLTQGDCFFHVGNNLIFPSGLHGTLRNRNENWRRFIKEKSEVLKKLVYHPELNINHPIKSLKAIIKSSKSKDQFISCIIKNHKLLQYSQKNHIRKHYQGYYLLNSTRIFGYYNEVFTYNWYLQNKEVCTHNIEYISGKGEDELRNTGIKIDDKVLIYYDFESEKFKVDFNKTKEFELIEDAVDIAIKMIKLENLPANQSSISV